MDSGGVVGDEAVEVRVYLEVVWNISVLLLRLIELHEGMKKRTFETVP